MKSKLLINLIAIFVVFVLVYWPFAMFLVGDQKQDNTNKVNSNTTSTSVKSF